jgi:hypothetical protein
MTFARLTHSACWLALMVLCFAGFAVAQTETGTISGLITDETGAVVPGADVNLQSVDRGTVESATTNNAGIYVFASVHPGPYQVTVHKPGFKQVDFLGLIVNVQDHIEQNFKLQIGSVSESITVTADSNNINTTDGSVSTVVTSEMVANMPLNGRSFQDLILLTPGTVTQTPQNGSSALGQTGEFSVNGQRPESNYYTVDGVSANVGAPAGQNMAYYSGSSGSLSSATALGTTQALVSVDDLQEFRVQSSTYSAEYGRNPGGQFAFQTKSGSNQLHGTGYDYLRNGVFDANDWFNNYFGKTEPDLRQNDFGGTVGGPVEIPHLYNGKDKSFFFVSYEGLRLTAPHAATINYVPDLCLRGSGACSSGETPAPSALEQALNAFPVPNGPSVGGGVSEFIASWSTPGSIDSTSVRIDHVVSDKLRLFFRFSDTASSLTSLGSGGGVQSDKDIAAYTMRTYTAGASSVFTNRLTNDFRLNYSSNEETDSTYIDAFGGSTPANLTQLSGLGAGSSAGLVILDGNYTPTLNQQPYSGALRQWNLVDTLSFSSGHHQLKFGWDYRRLASFTAEVSPAALYLYFGESFVETNTSDTIVAVDTPHYPRYLNFSAFVQDEWKVSRRLNLSMGLRWEVNPAPGVTQGLNGYTIQGSSPDTWALAPQGTPLWHTSWYNFAPRVGAAYLLHDAADRATVVRGGGGVFFDTGQQMGELSFTGPGFLAESNQFTSFPVPVATLAPSIVNPPVSPYASTPVGFSSHLQLPYTLQWNGSIDQQLGKSQALSLSYVGSHGARLLAQNQISTPSNPNAQTFIVVQNGLTSDYDSLQLQFRRRLSRGLTALASYTWSHCIDYGSQNYELAFQRGNCDFDVRHNLSTAFSYDLPKVGSNGLAEAILHNWGIDDRFTARTPFPVTLVGNTSFDPSTLTLVSDGLNLVPGQPIYLYGSNCASILQGLGDLSPGQGCPGGRAVNPNAFTAPATGLGDAPRNFVRGFDAVQMDLAVRREFPIHEMLKLQFRAEAFNIFNHPNFGTINPYFGQATFGQATATLANSLGILSPLYQMGGPRSMQFALKLVF